MVATPSVPKKTNIKLDVTHSRTMNLNRGMSIFVVLGYIASSTKLVFYGTEEVDPKEGNQIQDGSRLGRAKQKSLNRIFWIEDQVHE